MTEATISSIAKPFVQATGVNTKTGKTPFPILPALNRQHARRSAESAAENYLRAQAGALRSKGFNEPAARLFEEPNGDVNFVVFNAGRGTLSNADKLVPAEAQKYEHIIFTPT